MNSIKIHEAWCKRQQEDYEMMMNAADDVGAAALALASNGAQAYTQFIQARDNFKQMYKELNSHYRYVE